MFLFSKGGKFWLSGDVDWIPVTVTAIDPKEIKFLSEYGKVIFNHIICSYFEKFKLLRPLTS